MTQPFRPPDVARTVDGHEPGPMTSPARFVATFIVGWVVCADKLCHRKFNPIAEFEATMSLCALGTVLAITVLFFVGFPIRCIPALRQWWRCRSWPGASIIYLSLLLYWISWWPSFQGTIHDPNFPDIPEAYKQSYNRPLGLASWLLLLFGMLHYTRPYEVIPAPSHSADGNNIPEEAS